MNKPNKHQIENMLKDAKKFHLYMISKGFEQFSNDTINNLENILKEFK